jgi:hypothetical protein
VEVAVITLDQLDRLLGRRFVVRPDANTAIEVQVSSFDEHRVACCHVTGAIPARQRVPGDLLVASINAGALEEL